MTNYHQYVIPVLQGTAPAVTGNVISYDRYRVAADTSATELKLRSDYLYQALRA